MRTNAPNPSLRAPVRVRGNPVTHKRPHPSLRAVIDGVAIQTCRIKRSPALFPSGLPRDLWSLAVDGSGDDRERAFHAERTIF